MDSPYAVSLSREKNGGIPSLMIAVSAFEPVGAILLGLTAKKQDLFEAGFSRFFPRHLARGHLYNALRGALYHEGFIAGRVVVTELNEAFAFDGDRIYIDPRYFSVDVLTGFNRFCDEIERDPTLTKKFYEYWDAQLEINEEKHQQRPDRPLVHPYALSTPPGYNYSAAIPVFGDSPLPAGYARRASPTLLMPAAT